MKKSLVYLIVVFSIAFCRDARCYTYSDYTWYEYGGHQYAATFAAYF